MSGAVDGNKSESEGNGANGSRSTIDTGRIIGGIYPSPKLVVSDPGDSEKERGYHHCHVSIGYRWNGIIARVLCNASDPKLWGIHVGPLCFVGRAALERHLTVKGNR